MWDSMSEHLRYDHRMSPFSALGQPMHLQYSQYLELSKYAFTFFLLRITVDASARLWLCTDGVRSGYASVTGFIVF